MSQIRAKIAQQEYLLTCPDGQEELLQQAALEVDQALTMARHTGHLRTREQVATWVALHTMVELHQLRAQLAQMQPSEAFDAEAQQAQASELATLQAQHDAIAAQCQALVARLNHVLADEPEQAASEITEPADAPQESELPAAEQEAAAHEALPQAPLSEA